MIISAFSFNKPSHHIGRYSPWVITKLKYEIPRFIQLWIHLYKKLDQRNLSRPLSWFFRRAMHRWLYHKPAFIWSLLLKLWSFISAYGAAKYDIREKMSPQSRSVHSSLGWDKTTRTLQINVDGFAKFPYFIVRQPISKNSFNIDSILKLRSIKPLMSLDFMVGSLRRILSFGFPHGHSGR